MIKGIPSIEEQADLMRYINFLILGDQLKDSIVLKKKKDENGNSFDVARSKDEIMAVCISIIMRGAETGLSPQMALKAYYPTGKGNIGIEATPAMALVRKYYPEARIYPIVGKVKTTIWASRNQHEPLVPTTYTGDDAVQAGLWEKKGTWQTDPAGMIYYKCAIRMVNRIFPGVLYGTAIRESMQNWDTNALPPSESHMLDTIDGMHDILDSVDGIPRLPTNIKSLPPEEILSLTESNGDIPLIEEQSEPILVKKPMPAPLPLPLKEAPKKFKKMSKAAALKKAPVDATTKIIKPMKPLSALKPIPKKEAPTMVQAMKNPSDAQVKQLKKQVTEKGIDVDQAVEDQIEEMAGMLEEEDALTLVAKDAGITKIEEIPLSPDSSAEPPLLEQMRFLAEKRFKDANYFGSLKSKKKIKEDQAIQNYFKIIEARSQGKWYDNLENAFESGIEPKFDFKDYRKRFETFMTDKKKEQTNLEIAQLALWELSEDMGLDLECDRSLEQMMERLK